MAGAALVTSHPQGEIVELPRQREAWTRQELPAEIRDAGAPRTTRSATRRGEHFCSVRTRALRRPRAAPPKPWAPRRCRWSKARPRPLVLRCGCRRTTRARPPSRPVKQKPGTSAAKSDDCREDLVARRSPHRPPQGPCRLAVGSPGLVRGQLVSARAAQPVAGTPALRRLAATTPRGSGAESRLGPSRDRPTFYFAQLWGPPGWEESSTLDAIEYFLLDRSKRSFKNARKNRAATWALSTVSAPPAARRATRGAPTGSRACASLRLQVRRGQEKSRAPTSPSIRDADARRRRYLADCPLRRALGRHMRTTCRGRRWSRQCRGARWVARKSRTSLHDLPSAGRLGRASAGRLVRIPTGPTSTPPARAPRTNPPGVKAGRSRAPVGRDGLGQLIINEAA